MQIPAFLESGLARRLTLVALGAAITVGPGTAATAQLTEVERLPTHQKLVALTFDGGADAGGAWRIVATLRRTHVQATFFVTGQWVRRYPRLARMIARDYELGNHTYDHLAQTGLSSGAVKSDLRRGDFWIKKITHANPRPLFRFPYGARDARTIAIVEGQGYTPVRWSLDTWGWMGREGGQSTATVLKRVMTHLRRGDIVLMHLGAGRDRSELDALALPAVIRAIRRRGFRFVELRRFVRAP
jgi:peptidoglycan/xylan/chitin deacetylase (PgdA/CDA1 family)